MTHLFGFDFDSQPEPLRIVYRVFQELRVGKRGLLITINPEIMLHAWRNPDYYAIIKNALVRTIDGAGLAFFGFFLTKSRVYRACGSDMLTVFLTKAMSDDEAVHFILNPAGLVRKDQLQAIIQTRWPALRATFSEDEDEMPPNARILFANHGAPLQERLLDRIVRSSKKPCIGIGIGAAADFLVGTQTRAPRWMQKMGIEWLYRLIKQPWRIRRIINATIIFPITALFHLQDKPSTSLRQ